VLYTIDAGSEARLASGLTIFRKNSSPAMGGDIYLTACLSLPVSLHSWILPDGIIIQLVFQFTGQVGVFRDYVAPPGKAIKLLPLP